MSKSIPEISKKNRSVRAFEDAFLNLLCSTKCSDITITSIVAASDYSRTAFYSSFEDKTDFINKMVEREIIHFVHCIYDSVKDLSGKLFDGDIYLPAENLFEHVYERRLFYHMLNNEKIDGWNVASFTKCCSDTFTGNFHLVHDFKDSFNSDLYHYVETARYLSYIVYWDNHEFNFSPKYMAIQVGRTYKIYPFESIMSMSAL